MLSRTFFPFSAIVGQNQAKQALLIALVNPRAGGLLLGGKKGTAKTTLVRSASELIAPQHLVEVPLNVTEDMLLAALIVSMLSAKVNDVFCQVFLAEQIKIFFILMKLTC